jgi:hypothetical protein
MNSRWFRGRFQLKIRWEDHEEDQDEWRDYAMVMQEAKAWQEELSVEEPGVDPITPLVDEYYRRHPYAPQHSDPLHQCTAPPRH